MLAFQHDRIVIYNSPLTYFSAAVNIMAGLKQLERTFTLVFNKNGDIVCFVKFRYALVLLDGFNDKTSIQIVKNPSIS